jgi:hypothetical protein
MTFPLRGSSLLPLFILSCFGFPHASLAQDDRWFKVELLVFGQASQQNAGSEFWEPSPTLEYPPQFRFLVNPSSLETHLEEYNATGDVDEFGREILTVIAPLLDENGEPLLETSEEALTGIPSELPGDSQVPPEQALAEEPEILPLTPTPFTALAGSAMEFRGKAAYMARTGRYEILFHESWVQPVASQERALPIVLDRSGDTLEWPRLQGSVKLYLSRFLHIQTNLWLNTMGEYLPEYWQIPPAPLGPQSLIIEYPELPKIALEALASDESPPPIESIESDGELSAEGDLALDTEPLYPWHHAVLLQQTRRMRSTEVHYIDHPMLGVVVLVTPITDEELEAMAATEFAPKETPQLNP